MPGEAVELLELSIRLFAFESGVVEDAPETESEEVLLPLLPALVSADLSDIELHAASDAAQAKAINHLYIKIS